MGGKNYLSSNPAAAGLSRLLPPVVVCGVVAGFVALSWYAYRAGTQSIQNGTLLVVQADKTPVKEKPVNAGGMQFPGQDKTIFDTFSAAPKPLPKVERVLPAPEEPVTTPPDDTSGTIGWINDKFHKTAGNNPPPGNANPDKVVIVIPPPTVPNQHYVMQEVKKPAPAAALPQEFRAADTTPAPGDDQMTLYVAAPTGKNEEKNQEKTVLAAKKALSSAQGIAVKPVSPKKPAGNINIAAANEAGSASTAGLRKKSAAGTFKVQLGAYRSEKEAMAAWHAVQKKHAGLLSGMQPSVVKADLGARGIYYRLRTGGFAHSAEARALCGRLSAAGQACLIPTAK